MLILAAQRRLLPLATAARAGDWEVYEWPLLREIHRLSTRTVGIIGLGRIGHLVARKLHGFRLEVIANDPFIAGTNDPEVELVTLEELCARADIVVSCASLTESSRGLVDGATIARMKPGVIVVNVSRWPTHSNRVMSRTPPSTSGAPNHRTRNATGSPSCPTCC
jgi:phosphoglycerate dehydrogenase-like enzyme